METQIFKEITTYGVFAILFFFLLLYVLRKNDEREKRYIDTIEKDQMIIKNLTDNLRKMDKIEDDIKEIKNMVGGSRHGNQSN